MQSSDGGIYNASNAHSTTDLNVNTDKINPSLAIKDRATVRDSDNDNNNDIGDSNLGCAALHRRFLSDWPSILILLFLYMLQGLPFGLITSIPLIIQEKSATYNQQATFSLARWPNSLKILWAPLVDALYVKKIGRRKSWLVPVQYVLGIVLLVLSYQVDHLFDTMQVGVLTACFILLNFLAATQDIALDAWSLTMLKSENVALAATCNQVGQAFGIFIGHVVFLNLASEDFSNNYLRPVPKSGGIVTVSSFMLFWSCIYFVTTTLILIFKREGNAMNHENNDNSILKSYLRLYKIIKLPAVRWFVIFCFTRSIGLAAVNGVSDLKLVDAGISKETKALLTVPFIPITILFPLLITRWTGGPKPMSLFSIAHVLGLLATGAIAVMVWVTGTFKGVVGGFPGWYFPVLVLVECVYKICQTTMGVSHVAFSAQVSDPEHGGTFMTLYNTVFNLGSVSTQAIALWLVDPLTITKACNDATTVCDKLTTTIFDGYYIETIACILIGYCWFIWARRIINRLHKTPVSEFRLTEKRNNDT